jgi:hypothetical protein
MTKRLNILVAGGYDESDPKQLTAPVEDVKQFVAALGYAIIDAGHNLMTGCQTDLDRVVAEAAAEHPSYDEPVEGDEFRIVSYQLEGREMAHEIGTIIQSDRGDWDIGGPDPSPPELIKNCDVVVLIGGFLGAMKAANWARLDRKPILPFYRFGGTARDVYATEARRFDETYGSKISRLRYDQVVKSTSKKWSDVARDTVQLAEDVAITRSVLVCMSFEPKPEYEDLLEAIKAVAEQKHGFTAERIDEDKAIKRVVPEILRQVRQSAFVIVDVSEAKPNVYYELGFADGAAKNVILTAKKGTELPFNISDMNAIMWDSFKGFKEQLDERIEAITSMKTI